MVNYLGTQKPFLNPVFIHHSLLPMGTSLDEDDKLFHTIPNCAMPGASPFFKPWPFYRKEELHGWGLHSFIKKHISKANKMYDHF